MFLTEIVKAHGHRLTETDRRLVIALRSNPAQASFWRAAELTEPLGLHQSSATRLAQRLGFEGYPQLRDAIRQDYLAGDGPSQRVRGRLERSPGENVLESFVADEADALRALPLHVSQRELDEVAEKVVAAREIYLYGQGNATILVDQLASRLQRFGVRTVALVGSRRDIAERVARLEPSDLVIAFAFRRVPTTLPPLLEVAAQVGAASVLITDTLLSLSPAPDSIIAAPRGSNSEFLSLTVPMAISNSLVLTVARRSPEPALASLDRLALLLEHFDA